MPRKIKGFHDKYQYICKYSHVYYFFQNFGQDFLKYAPAARKFILIGPSS